MKTKLKLETTTIIEGSPVRLHTKFPDGSAIYYSIMDTRVYITDECDDVVVKFSSDSKIHIETQGGIMGVRYYCDKCKRLITEQTPYTRLEYRHQVFLNALNKYSSHTVNTMYCEECFNKIFKSDIRAHFKIEEQEKEE